MDASVWLPPVLDARRTAQRFTLHSRVFFTFIMYQNDRPQYLHGIGPRLQYWDATGTCLAAPSAAAGRAGRNAQGHGGGWPRWSGGRLGTGYRHRPWWLAGHVIRSLDALCLATTWAHGERWALFPTAFSWEVETFLRHARGTAPLAPSALVTGGASTNRSLVQQIRLDDQRQARQQARDQGRVLSKQLPELLGQCPGVTLT